MAKKKSLEWQNCSETELERKLEAWLISVDLRNTILFLDGEMGVGKSTFVRVLLQFLAPEVKTAGSPTFSLVQEYQARAGFPIYHIDLYRIKTEAELQDSGIETQIEEQGALSCVEWGSLFQDFFSFWMNIESKKAKQVIRVEITAGKNQDDRTYVLTQAQS